MYAPHWTISQPDCKVREIKTGTLHLFFVVDAIILRTVHWPPNKFISGLKLHILITRVLGFEETLDHGTEIVTVSITKLFKSTLTWLNKMVEVLSIVRH